MAFDPGCRENNLCPQYYRDDPVVGLTRSWVTYSTLNGGTTDGVTSMESRGGPEALAFWPGFGLREGQARPKAPSGQDFGLALALVPKPWLFGLRPKPEHH
ncbi:hypothetical protein B0H11DRAFT_2199365 [Mycena galericulata]|nr:hypothetical protein B0H11DRAFT_2199365 [Mycena galericulata]